MSKCVLISVGRILVFLTLFIVTSCTTKPEDLSENVPISKILNLADKAKIKKRFSEAGNFYMEIDRLHPYSDESRLALVEAMKSYHDGGDLLNSRISAKRYLALYPSGENAAFSQYMIGLSFFDAIVDVERDQGAASHAVREFTHLINAYPSSSFVKKVKSKLITAHSQLAGQEMSVGRFYMRRQDYLAATNRFLVVTEKYFDTVFSVEAFYRLTEVYLVMGLTDLAEQNNVELLQAFPNSDWALKSTKLINAYTG